MTSSPLHRAILVLLTVLSASDWMTPSLEEAVLVTVGGRATALCSKPLSRDVGTPVLS